MRATLGVWVAGVLAASCGAKTVEQGGDPAHATGGAANLSHSTTGGAANPSNTATGGLNQGDGGQPAAGNASYPAAGANGKAGSGGGHGVAPTCGDAHLDASEACDDGNRLSGDGCSEGCTVEPGWSCITGSCGWLCGDHLVSAPEQCVVGTCPNAALVPPEPPAPGSEPHPCDIYAADGGPCVAAHSTVRALYATYAGPLYQVKNARGETHDIAPLEPGGFADSAAQDGFCAAGACTITIIYDQSGWGNQLTKAPAGGGKGTPGNEANAKALPVEFGAHPVYGLHVVPGVAYRNNQACGTATGDDAETEYMVVAGDFYNAGCCFDYGNVERDSRDDGEGAAEAVYFGSTIIWGKGAGSGPWVMADLENGVWAGDVSPYAPNESLDFKYVTAMVKGDAAGKNHWAIKTGNAQSGPLRTFFDGARPSAKYNPMRKQGGIGLGAAGDNSNGAQGNFFEGVMTAHFSSSAADAAVQANIVSVYAVH